MKAKKFPLRVLLTVTTGRLLTAHNGEHDNGISDLYELLGWMTDDEPFTHQLGRVSKEYKPWLLRWFPELGKADCRLQHLDNLIKNHGPETGIATWLDSLDGCKSLYDVPKIPKDDHEAKNPIEELAEMIGPNKNVVVVEAK